MALVKRGKKYSARYVIPVHMREVLGKSQVWKATGTGCLSEAKRREPRIMADIIDAVEDEYKHLTQSSDTKGTPAHLFEITEELLGKVASGEMTEEQASDVLHDYREEFLKANSKPSGRATFTTARSATAMLTSGGKQVPLSIEMHRHLDDLKRRGRNLSTVERKAMVIQRFCDFTGDPLVSDVDREMVSRWIDDDLNQSDLKAKTKEWYISALQAAWTYFLRRGAADGNPFQYMAELTKLSVKGIEEEQPRRTWSQDELDKLKSVDRDDPIYTVSVIRLHSGIRVEEACCLRVQDIDLEANTMRIGGITKNQSSQRILPMHPVVQKLMPKLIENATEDGFLFDVKPGGRDKKRSHNYSKRVGRWIRKNVTTDKGVTGYTLRHTYSQALRDLGVDRETIEYTTGHKDQSMLFGTYAKEVALKRLRDAVERLDFGFEADPEVEP